MRRVVGVWRTSTWMRPPNPSMWGAVPVKAAGSSDATCRVRLSGVPTAAAGA
jgi:hypothetical protein